jgi:hypothetical protein
MITLVTLAHANTEKPTAVTPLRSTQDKLWCCKAPSEHNLVIQITMQSLLNSETMEPVPYVHGFAILLLAK